MFGISTDIRYSVISKCKIIMMNLDTFIKNHIIKERYANSHIVIKDIDECYKYAELIAQEIIKDANIIFEATYLKNMFFSTLKTNRQDISIINCNSNPELFEDNLYKSNKLVIFNNVHMCKEEFINDIKKGIWVC